MCSRGDARALLWAFETVGGNCGRTSRATDPINIPWIRSCARH
ncbi:MAG: hypothetical protein ACK55Z_33900 [bacterium]